MFLQRSYISSRYGLWQKNSSTDWGEINECVEEKIARKTNILRLCSVFKCGQTSQTAKLEGVSQAKFV